MTNGNGGRARARAWAQDTLAAARRRQQALGLPDLAGFAETFAERIGGWARADAGVGRLMPWLPVVFGLGIASYFAADREPVWWVAAGLAAMLAGIACAVRARPFAFPLVVGLTAIASGFTIAALKSARIQHPVLQAPLSFTELSGFVEVREERARSDRIVLRIHGMKAGRDGTTLERVRINVRKGTAPAVGTFVSLRARLTPPLQPLRPGGYDFARDLYFQGIGATGFALGQIRQIDPPAPPGLWLRYAAAVGSLRDAIDARIRAVVSGDRGAIASALITGKRDAISTPVNDAMYVSSLAHVLSISGYHMAVVAGVVFFAVRASLALIPSFASRHPVKKWVALAALVAAAFYLALSGAEVATQRSFIMTAIVLVGVMLDRPALTLRTIATAALAVMLIAPEAIVHPSFQMSFAATLALIAAYERGLPWLSAVPDTPLGTRLALWGGREVVGLIVASLVAGLATTLYAALHFHRLAPYGVLANLLAMPVVSAWVMPSGLLALLAIPFGFDAPLWRLMADGIDWMIKVALWVASLPGAVGRVPAFGIGAVLVGTAGLVVLCLLRSPLRFAGGALIAAAIVLAMRTSPPDILVASDAGAAAIRTTEGRLSVIGGKPDAFMVGEWLAADADARTARDATLSQHTRCDPDGCIATRGDGSLVALSLTQAALLEDCGKAAVVISARRAPAGCMALVIDRSLLQGSGALALSWNGKGYEITAARPAGYVRPWTPQLAARALPPAPATEATPAPADIED